MMIPNRRRSRQSSEELDQWLDAIAEEMGGESRHVAHHALRGVLTAARDCLSLTDAHHLALQLPILIRTHYYQGFHPAERPIPQGCDEFVARVRAEVRAGGSDRAEDAVAAVLRVMDRFVGSAELTRVMRSLPAEIRALTDDHAITV